jgi:hypothetical protein
MFEFSVRFVCVLRTTAFAIGGCSGRTPPNRAVGQRRGTLRRRGPFGAPDAPHCPHSEQTRARPPLPLRQKVRVAVGGISVRQSRGRIAVRCLVTRAATCRDIVRPTKRRMTSSGIRSIEGGFTPERRLGIVTERISHRRPICDHSPVSRTHCARNTTPIGPSRTEKD